MPALPPRRSLIQSATPPPPPSSPSPISNRLLPADALAPRAPQNPPGFQAIPSTYREQNSSPPPGEVAGIVLGSVGAFVFLLALLYSCLGQWTPVFFAPPPKDDHRGRGEDSGRRKHREHREHRGQGSHRNSRHRQPRPPVKTKRDERRPSNSQRPYNRDSAGVPARYPPPQVPQPPMQPARRPLRTRSAEMCRRPYVEEWLRVASRYQDRWSYDSPRYKYRSRSRR